MQSKREENMQGGTPKKAMILGAGLGTRMRPITNTIPKPLVEINGKTLLDYGLDALVRAGVETAVVNVHYLADKLEEHVKGRTDIEVVFSDEREELLNSGGGIYKALPSLGGDPFYLINADSFWLDGATQNLNHMAQVFDPSQMDIMLLLSDLTNAVGFSSKGDFHKDKDGHLNRRHDDNLSAYAYAGAAIIKPQVFDNAKGGAFSLNDQFDQTIEDNTLFGTIMDGLWLHVGTPEAIDDAEEAITKFTK